MKRMTYGVAGMHCPSCEAIIEKKIKALNGVIDAKASMTSGLVTISYEGEAQSAKTLQKLFPEGLYSFSISPAHERPLIELMRVTGYAAVVLTLFFGLSASGLLPALTIDTKSSAGSFFLFGLIAGMSTCAALVGSLVLALSAQWLARNDKPSSFSEKIRPQILFNTGRISAYAFTGAMLGLLGESIRLSPDFTAAIVIGVSVLMLILAFQMLGFTPLRRLRIALPKWLIDKAGRGVTRNGLIRPFPTGFMTILLPCGFTMAAEGAAILSGSLWQGMAIMTFFVLGTLPPLLIIGFSSSEFSSRPSTSRIFMKTAGLLVIFFTIYNLNSQFGIAGKLASGGNQAPPATTSGAARIIRTSSSGGTLATSRFELKQGEKVRFIIDARDNGAGCMNAIMVPGLWNRAEYLVKGKPLVLEFTPSKPGSYQITCAMGMPWGVINVK
ncbi:MAG: sulfite exporter TauE/SafE family protein [Chlorobaculum sp.]